MQIELARIHHVRDCRNQKANIGSRIDVPGDSQVSRPTCVCSGNRKWGAAAVQGFLLRIDSNTWRH
jgi:hypothetical protein